MRVYLYDRSNNAVLQMAEGQELSSGLSYETAQPGGMTIASCRVPWNICVQNPDLLGYFFVLRDGMEIVWQGRILSTKDTVQGGERYIEITAYGPWEACARAPWTQTYATTGSPSASTIIGAALFGNVEDALISTDNWTCPSANLAAASVASWTDSNVQTVITDCLRLGDSSASAYSCIFTPPRFDACNRSGWQFAESGSTIASFTKVANASVFQGLHSRGGESIMFGTGAASGQCTVAVEASSAYHAQAYFWTPRSYTLLPSPPALIRFQTATCTNIAEVRVGLSPNVLVGYSYGTTGSIATTASIGGGCWHSVYLYVASHATTGRVKIVFDNVVVLNQTSVGTTGSQIARVGWGPFAAQTMYVASMIATCAAIGSPPPIDATIVDETLPELQIFRMDTSTYDFIVSLADFGSSYSLTRSLDYTANQTETAYGAGTSNYTGFQSASDSVTNYGQFFTLVSASRGQATTASGLGDRFFSDYQNPKSLFDQFTLRVPPMSVSGAPYPLSEIRAGLRFKIRERPDLGIMYVGHTRYQRGEAGQQEECQVTPAELPQSVEYQVARRQSRTY